jgi:hypothetical protein
MVGAVVVALIAYATMFAVLRRLTRANSTATVIVDYTAQPAKLVLPLLALKLTLPEMLEGLRHSVVFSEFITILLTLSLTWLVMRIIAGVEEALVRLNPTDTSDNINARHLQT